MKKKELVQLAHARKQATVLHWNGFFPIAIFSPDGTAEHVNEYFLRIFGIKEASLFIGKYNLLHDQTLGSKKSIYPKIEKAFNGKKVTIPNFKAPFKTFMDMGMVKEKPSQMPLMDADLFPAYENKKIDAVYCTIKIKQ